jgi:glutamyl/glutaminyl-tRNA synthetase
VLLFEPFGAPVPSFAHVPLSLGADTQRLSTRHGATSVSEYQRQGYLPEAMVNFLAMLGWATGGDRELMSVPELVESFSLEGISGGNAVFDSAKLDWMNGQYLAKLPVEELAHRVAPLLAEAGIALPTPPDAWCHRLLELLRPRAKRLTEFAELARPFLVDTVEYEAEAIEKHLTDPALAGHLGSLDEALRATVPFDETHVETAVRGTAAACGIKAGALIHGLRVAMTGRTSSPGIFEVLVLLGPDRVHERLQRLVNFLATRA